MDVDKVRTGLTELPDIAYGFRDHQMRVKEQVCRLSHGFQNRNSHGNIGYEMSVHDIEMKPLCPGVRNLGELFHRTYVDTDHMVELSLGKRVAQIFEEDGEDAFRDAETRALKRLELRKSLLVSCGGGIVERPENCELMHEMGVIVFLDGDLEDSLRQIQCPERRPDLGDRANAERVYSYRRPLYEQAADITIDIRNKSFTEVAAASGQLLWERGLL